VVDETALDEYGELARLKKTEARKLVDAIRKERLSDDGTYPLEMFSPPTAVKKCEHRFLRKMVLGGPDDYFCDDCEWQLSFPQPFAVPKQHIVPYALMKIAWSLKYDGPEAVAAAMIRPHLRLDKEGHPSEPPISVLLDQEEQLKKVLDIVREHRAELMNGHQPKELPESES
jgi:hypothetical protein